MVADIPELRKAAKGEREKGRTSRKQPAQAHCLPNSWTRWEQHTGRSALFFIAVPRQSWSSQEATLSWTGITQPTSRSCSVFNPASAFPFVAGMGAYNGPERLHSQNRGDIPAWEKSGSPGERQSGTMPVLMASELPGWRSSWRWHKGSEDGAVTWVGWLHPPLSQSSVSTLAQQIQ